MNSKTTLFVMLSLVFGVIAVYLAQNWLAKNNQEPSPLVTNKVVTMATKASMGTVLERKHLMLTQFPKSLVPEGAVTELKKAIGMVVKQALYQGEILRHERIVKKGAGSTLASLITPHMRAVTIRVNDVVGVAGFLLPGNRVDILNLYKKSKKLKTDVILANIKILAIDQRASNDENKPKIVRAVTLEVNLAQAEILMLAKGRGKLQLALRNPNDQAVIELASIVPPKRESKLQQAVALPEQKVAPKVKTVVRYVSSKKNKVYLIKGIKETEVKVETNN